MDNFPHTWEEGQLRHLLLHVKPKCCIIAVSLDPDKYKTETLLAGLVSGELVSGQHECVIRVSIGSWKY